jgi:hypothetical protein
MEELTAIRAAEGWHARYAPQAKAAPGYETGLPTYRPGEVY